MRKVNALISTYCDTNINIQHRFDYQCQTNMMHRHNTLRRTKEEPTPHTHKRHDTLLSHFSFL
ncbi:hypothetical protein HMPREF1254_1718 [Prevotella sp. BV3P1]|nr:hypothetical protein HMPREF1254_1718 [Prevotella sp. BV3P1]